jgi:hypothetical protein
MTSASPSLLQRTARGAILTVATVVASWALACATPFAGLAALAALFLPRRDAFVLIGVTWLANQAIGFGLLDYPLDWSTVRGGLNLGAAAFAGTAAAMAAHRALRQAGFTAAVIGTLAAAFVAYEGAVLVLSPWRTGSDFNLSTTLYILYINGLAFAGLLVLQNVALAVGLTVPRAVVPAPPRISTAS